MKISKEQFRHAFQAAANVPSRPLPLFLSQEAWEDIKTWASGNPEEMENHEKRRRNSEQPQ